MPGIPAGGLARAVEQDDGVVLDLVERGAEAFLVVGPVMRRGWGHSRRGLGRLRRRRLGDGGADASPGGGATTMTRAATRIRTVVVGAMAAGGSRKETASNTCRDRVGEGLDRGSLTYIGRGAEADKRGRGARRRVTVRSRRRTARGRCDRPAPALDPRMLPSPGRPRLPSTVSPCTRGDPSGRPGTPWRQRWEFRRPAEVT